MVISLTTSYVTLPNENNTEYSTTAGGAAAQADASRINTPQQTIVTEPTVGAAITVPTPMTTTAVMSSVPVAATAAVPVPVVSEPQPPPESQSQSQSGVIVITQPAINISITNSSKAV